MRKQLDVLSYLQCKRIRNNLIVLQYYYKEIISIFKNNRRYDHMGAKWIKISVLYLILGISFGLFMHATVELQWAATHGHINVIGSLTTGLMGVIYAVYPNAGNSDLGKLHFWSYNIGLPFLLLGMMVIYLSPPAWLLELLVVGGGGLVTLGVLAFIINIFRNVRHVES